MRKQLRRAPFNAMSDPKIKTSTVPGFDPDIPPFPGPDPGTDDPPNPLPAPEPDPAPPMPPGPLPKPEPVI